MLSYVVVPEGYSSFYAIFGCNDAQEAFNYAKRRNEQTGNEYSVLEVRRIVVSEIMKMQREQRRIDMINRAKDQAGECI